MTVCDVPSRMETFDQGRQKAMVADKFNLPVQGTRGLLALAILLFHVGNSHLKTFAVFETPAAHTIVSSLQAAVEIFFCISGYVISGTLRRADSPASFLANRFWRIMPLLWIVVTVALIMEIIGNRRHANTMDHVTMAAVYLANLAALPGIVPIHLIHDGAWSISYEVAFYVICAIAWQIRRRGGPHTVFIWPVCVAMVFFYPRGLFFLPGLIVAEGRCDFRSIRRMARYPGLCLAGFFAVWMEVRTLCGGLLENGMAGWLLDERIVLTVTAFILALSAFRGIVEGNGLLCMALRMPVMQRLGAISYGFYLWQFPVLGALKFAMVRSGTDRLAGEYAQAVFLAGALVLVFLVANASYVWIEQRLVKRLRAAIGERSLSDMVWPRFLLEWRFQAKK